MVPSVQNGGWGAAARHWPANRLESLFERVFNDAGLANESWGGLPLAMWEDEDRIHVEVETPGVAEGDIDLTVHEGVLYIRGERKPAQDRRYLYNGRTFGRFQRAIALPEAVNAEAVEARLCQGVLQITLPKRPESKPRKIAVQGG